MAALTLVFTHIDPKNEKAVLENRGAENVDLAGTFLRDIKGGNKSAPFEAFSLVAGASVTFWTCPGGKKRPKTVYEDEQNLFWRNATLSLRSKPVLNDEGDGLELVREDGTVIASGLAEPEVAPAMATKGGKDKVDAEPEAEKAEDEDGEVAEAEEPEEPEEPEAPVLSARELMIQRLALAKAQRLTGRQENQEGVAEEDRKAKLPANYEARKRRAEAEIEEERKRKEAQEQGLDFDRLRYLETTAEESDRYHRIKAAKKAKSNTNHGFASFEDETKRKYEKQVSQLKPDMAEHDRSAAEWGDDTGADSLKYGKIPGVTKEGLDRLKQDLETKSARHRRRANHVESDVDYINHPNQRYNQMLDRFYGKYTKDIKDNFERGTAL